MNNTLKKISLAGVISLLILLTGGCEDTTVTTEIFPDGSCRRIVEVKSDSKNIYDDVFPIPRDPSWNIEEERVGETKKGNIGDKGHLYSAEKYFPDVSALNDEFSIKQKDPRSPGLDIRVSLEKSFSWFFTVYEYRETYREFFPFKKVPLSEYLSPDEFEILKLYMVDNEKAKSMHPEELLKGVEEKFNTWANRAIFEDLYQILLTGAKQSEHPRLTPALIASHKEALFAATLKGKELFAEISLDELLKKYADLLQVPGEVMVKLGEQQKKELAQFEIKYRMFDRVIGDEYTNNVIMPGLITDTNANTVTGNQVTWEFSMVEFLINDHEMWVKSRTLNWWFVGAAALILILVIALLVRGALARRK
jgi:hypothetical protein